MVTGGCDVVVVPPSTVVVVVVVVVVVELVVGTAVVVVVVVEVVWAQAGAVTAIPNATATATTDGAAALNNALPLVLSAARLPAAAGTGCYRA